MFNFPKDISFYLIKEKIHCKIKPMIFFNSQLFSNIELIANYKLVYRFWEKREYRFYFTFANFIERKKKKITGYTYLQVLFSAKSEIVSIHFALNFIKFEHI